MPLSNIPIRRKLMVIFLLTSGVVMLLMRGAFFVYEYLTFHQAIHRHVSSLGEIVARNSTAALAFTNPDDAREILSAFRSEPQITAAALFDQDGRLFAHYPTALAAANLPAKPGPAGYRLAGTRLSGYQPVRMGDRTLGTLYLEFESGDILREWLWDSVKIAFGVMAVILFIAYLLSQALQSQVSKPILDLASTARAISQQGDYSARAVKRGNDELGQLTDSFNRMLDELQVLQRDLEKRVIERTTQLEAANRELEAFSYSVSHDLRAPLRHIDGFAGLLQKHAGASLDDQGRRFLTTISDSARRMGRLIDDLLSFSRMGRAQMQPSLVDQDALVATVVRDGRYPTGITWRIAPLPPARGDHAMLRQVWSNLIDNAVKYSGKVADPSVEIASHLDAATGELVFSVRDNGAGFDMRYAGKLFGVFQRLHGANEFEGTGIGLANVRRIVTRHGGRTWAESAPGRGATFYFSLPATPPSLPS